MLNTSKNKTIVVNHTYKTEISDDHVIINDLFYISKYIDDIVRKQSSLLNNINNSAFHTIQKHALIKHKYIHHANIIITDSNVSLEREKVTIDNILPIIRNHPYTYQYYLNIKNYTIPNISFFIKNKSNKKYLITDIRHKLSYVNNTSNNLNSISFNSEKVVFGTEAISKAGFYILTPAFKDYHFKANIICYNCAKNLFKFMKLTKNDPQNIIHNYIIDNEKKNKLNNMNRVSLVNSISKINYPA